MPFPNQFVWGAAAASYHIEGEAKTEGGTTPVPYPAGRSQATMD